MDNKLEPLFNKNKIIFKWLYNKIKEIERDYWETSDFLKIKNKKTNRKGYCDCISKSIG